MVKIRVIYKISSFSLCIVKLWQTCVSCIFYFDVAQLIEKIHELEEEMGFRNHEESEGRET